MSGLAGGRSVKPHPAARSTTTFSPRVNALRSMPAQNVPPAPVSTPTDEVRVVVETIHRVGQPAAHRGVDRVFCFRPVDRDHQYAIPLLDKNFRLFAHHRPKLFADDLRRD